MKTAKKILHECFFGVLGFNEKCALTAMKKYAKFYHKKKLAKIHQPRRSPDEAPTKPRRSPDEAPTIKFFPHF
jgi:hypothetical protein